MSNNTCPVEELVTSRYCQLAVCMECKIIHLNLPARMSFQFDLNQFLEIADAFSKAALMLRNKTKKKSHNSKKSAKVIMLDAQF
jgi:hypothetical protein